MADSEVQLYDEPPTGFKKRRTPGACDLCKQFDVRTTGFPQCDELKYDSLGDSAKMPGNICSNCKSFNSECTHSSSNKKKHTFINMATVPQGSTSQKQHGTINNNVQLGDNFSFAKRQISVILDAPSYQVPVNDQTLLQRTLTEISAYARSLEKTLSETGPYTNSRTTPEPLSKISSHSSPSSNIDVSSTSLHPTDPTAVYSVYRGHGITEDDMTNNDPVPAEVNLADSIKNLELKESDHSFFGKSSQLALVKTALKIKEEYDGVTSRPTNVTETSIPHKSDYILQSETQGVLFDGKKRAAFWDVYPWQRPTLPSQPALTFPPLDLLTSLVDLYFIHRNTFFPLLHRPTFQRGLDSHLHERERAFGELVLSVCALGARFSSDERVCADGAPRGSEERFHSAGWQYVNQIGSLQEDSQNTLYKVQTICNIIIFLSSTSSPGPIWTLLSIGVRHAQAIGAHRRPFLGTKPSVKHELWKRAYWILISLDSFTSAYLGRPKATDPAEYDLDLPIECDDEFWEHPDPEQAFKQPQGRPSLMTFWTTHLKLMDILAFAQKNLYAVKKPSEIWGSSDLQVPSWDAKVVSELDAALNRWVDQIPDHLRWDPHREDLIFFGQSCSLYCTYYFVQIHVHRPFIRPEIPRTSRQKNYSGMSYSSLGVCANAARSCLHVLDLHSRRTDFHSPQPSPESTSSTSTASVPCSAPSQMTNSPVILFNSVIMILLNLWSGKRLGFVADFKREMEDVYLSLRILKGYEKKYQNAGRMCDIIDELISVMDPSDVSTGSRPRKRDRDEDKDRNRVRVREPMAYDASHTPVNNPHRIFESNITSSFKSQSSLSDAVPNVHDQILTPPTNSSIFPSPSAPLLSSSFFSQSDSTLYPEASNVSSARSTGFLDNAVDAALELPLHTEDLGRLPIHLGSDHPSYQGFYSDVDIYASRTPDASLGLKKFGANPVHGFQYTDMSSGTGNDPHHSDAVVPGIWGLGGSSSLQNPIDYSHLGEPRNAGFIDNVEPDQSQHSQDQSSTLIPAENAFTNMFNATPARDGWFDWGMYLSNVDDLLRTVDSTQ
ncbi:fungal-specific transcription factor domain-containing protein [Lentinula aff. detonsa]|nr:fungal-specific transcription factor domain-containing protein [Lentinula aff. detonsa]